MLNLNDILNNSSISSARTTTKKTRLNVLMFYKYLINNPELHQEAESDLYSGIISLAKRIKKEGCANRSHEYWFSHLKHLSRNEELFNDFVENHLDKNDPDYIEYSQYCGGRSEDK